MKNYKFILLLLLVGTLATTSCKKYVEGVNDDPNTFTDAPASLIVGHAQMAAIGIAESQASRSAGVFTDQFTGSLSQFIPLDRYDTSTGDYDAMWVIMLYEGGAQAKIAMEKAATEGLPQVEGISEILYAYAMGETAILFGDIPYSEAFNDEIRNPKYDQQDVVLTDVIAKLENALTKVQANKATNVAFVDNSFNWVEVAHSLKARYYLAMKDYDNALIEAQAGISSAAGDLLSLHEDISGKKNMYYQFCAEQRNGNMTANGSGTNAGSGSTMYRWLSNRPSGLLTPGDLVRRATYFDGMDINTSDYFAVDASYPIISWVETKLIEAEAAQRTGGDALTPFNDVRNYLATKYAALFPATASTGAQLLTEILEEKYLSLPGGLQVFQDIRRTDNLIGVQIKKNGATSIPQRFLYPEAEINANENFPGLVDLFTKTRINQ